MVHIQKIYPKSCAVGRSGTRAAAKRAATSCGSPLGRKTGRKLRQFGLGFSWDFHHFLVDEEGWSSTSLFFVFFVGVMVMSIDIIDEFWKLSDAQKASKPNPQRVEKVGPVAAAASSPRFTTGSWQMSRTGAIHCQKKKCSFWRKRWAVVGVWDISKKIKMLKLLSGEVSRDFLSPFPSFLVHPTSPWFCLVRGFYSSGGPRGAESGIGHRPNQPRLGESQKDRTILYNLYQSICINLYQSICINLYQFVSICINLYQFVSICPKF